MKDKDYQELTEVQGEIYVPGVGVFRRRAVEDAPHSSRLKLSSPKKEQENSDEEVKE